MSIIPDIVPISDLRQDASNIVKRATSSGKPVFITQRGRPSAVLVSTGAYERTQNENEMLRLLAKGTAEIEAGVGYDFKSVMAEADELLNT